MTKERFNHRVIEVQIWITYSLATVRTRNLPLGQLKSYQGNVFEIRNPTHHFQMSNPYVTMERTPTADKRTRGRDNGPGSVYQRPQLHSGLVGTSFYRRSGACYPPTIPKARRSHIRSDSRRRWNRLLVHPVVGTHVLRRSSWNHGPTLRGCNDLRRTAATNTGIQSATRTLKANHQTRRHWPHWRTVRRRSFFPHGLHHRPSNHQNQGLADRKTL